MWKIEFYNKTVENNIQNWPDGMMSKFLWLLNFIEEFGPNKIGAPYVKDLGQGLFKISTKGHIDTGYALFCIVEQDETIIILDGFLKTTQQTLSTKTALARNHMNEINVLSL